MQALKIKLSDRAIADIETIVDYGSDRFGIEATRDFVRGLDDVFKRLSNFPKSGRPRDDIIPGLRVIRYSPYLVFYRIRDDLIVVLRIIHSSRLQRPEMFGD